MAAADWLDAETVYGRLPVVLQHAVCSAEGRRLHRQRYGRGFEPVLLQAEHRCVASIEELSRFRDSRLRRFVAHCAQTVPYYRHWFRDNGANPDDIKTLGDLHQLPILTKTEVQADVRSFESEQVPNRDRVKTHTSGTTGAGLRFCTTLSGIREQYAVWWRYRGWHGLRRGTWCGHFGGRSVVPIARNAPPYWRYDWLGRRVLFSGYHMSDDGLADYVGELRRRRLPWLHGYPSALSVLAAYIVDRGIDLGYQIRWVTVGGENLLAGQRELMHRAFGVRPVEHYGLAEAVANISECDRGALHIDEDFAAVELLPEPDGPGLRVVGCNFTNLATPLLRYDTGDVVTLDGAECDCGRRGRVVRAVDGRLEDYVVLHNGARVGRMDHVFKDLTNVREAQVHQRQPGELQVRVVRGESYGGDDERQLMRELTKRVGAETHITISYAEQIERVGSGKLRFVVSEMPTSTLEDLTT